METDQEFKRWGLGVIVPLFPSFYGINGLIFRSVAIESRGGRWVVIGSEAVAVSLAYLFLALFLHTFFFWENRERLAGYRELLVIASLVGFLGSVAYFVYLECVG